MPAIRRIRKVANPRRKTASSRRKMSAKQIRFFGTKRQKSALKASRKRKSTTTTKSRSRSKNPALLLTLGAVNPKKRGTRKMARRKVRRAAPKRRRRTASRSNPRPVVRRRRRRVARAAPVRRRRRNPVRRRRVTRRRRNPSLFGLNVGGNQMAQAVLGGLLGVAAAKFIPSVIPINLGGGNVVRTIISGISAFVAGWAGQKFVGKPFGDAVLFGGLMQAGSVALNAFLPMIGERIALSGMGEIVPTGGFVVPSNPVTPVQARIEPNGLDRAYGRPF